MKRKILALILCTIMLTSCSFEVQVEDLLTAPTLTTTQKSINSAISSAIGSDSYRFIFPQNGNHLSACSLFDVDSDGKDEAVVFYELTSNAITSTWICFLKQQENGQWTTIKQIPSQANIVDRIEFVNIFDSNMYSVFVGWKNSGSSTSGVFYKVTTDDIIRLDGQYTYSDLVAKDINNDNKQELLLLDTTDSKTAKMLLLQGINNDIQATSSIKLPSDIISIVNMQAGAITSGLNGIMCDVELSSKKIDTIIALVNDDETETSLELISAYDLTPFSSFQREQSNALSKDINGDGYLDFVHQEVLQGYERVSVEDALYLTEYYSIIDGEFKLVGRTIINEKDGYTIMIPNSWDDNITVYEDTLSNEWILKYYDGTIGVENQNEILAIRARSSIEYKDIFESTVYETVLSRGTTEYQIRLPNHAPVGFNVSIEQAKDMIVLN